MTPGFDLLLAHGRALIAAGRDDDALTYFRALERQCPREPLGAIELARLCARLGRNDDAIAAYERALALDPAPEVAIAALAELAELLAATGREDEAVAIRAEAQRRAAERDEAERG
jgi:Flp pilus assembly protein TadD